VRRIALRPPTSYFDRRRFAPSRDPTPLERFRDGANVIGGIKQDWWVVEKPANTQSLPAATSGASESADIEEGGDSEEGSDSEGAQGMFCSLVRIHVCR